MRKGEEISFFQIKKGYFFLSSDQKGLFCEVKINSLKEGKKIILGYLKKSDGYSLEEQYPLVEEDKKLEV